MNILDSELAVSELVLHGYERVETPKNADIILFNTCSVREHAEEKIYSALGRLKHWKETRPHGIIGVMGCMAQKDQKIIFKRAPHVDLVLGPGQLDRLPELIETLKTGRNPQMAVSLNRTEGNKAVDVKESFRQYDPKRLLEARESPWQAMVRIMFGCNKFCTYCIVPSVRGPEQSRSIEDIVREVQKLAQQGCLEVTLIGQTVNNYHWEEDGKKYSLANLLERINDIEGLERIRFVSNYPTGMTNELLEAVRDLPKVMPFIHVPAQHGADSVLKRMHRMYTVNDYKRLVERIYDTIPNVSITSDFIVGFCGETEEEFQQTVELVRFARFKNSFIFKYSVRKGTKAAELYADDVSEEDKKRRNNELLDVQNEISTEDNRQFIGRTVEILVEGPSKAQSKMNPSNNDSCNDLSNDSSNDSSKTIPLQNLRLPLFNPNGQSIQLTGRTPCDRIVVFDGLKSQTGTFQKLKITDSAPFTLFGQIEATE